MKNKIAAILLTGAMTAVLLAGCGKTAADTENLMESTEAATEAVFEEAAEETTEEVEEEVTEVLEETEEPETEAPAVVQTTMYAQQKVNVRSLPSTDGEILGSLSANDPVIVVGDASENGWYTVTYCEQTAYVKANYLGTEKVEIKASSSSGKQGTSSASNSSTANSENTNTSSGGTGTNSGSDNGGSQEAASQPAEQPTAAPAEQPAAAPAEQPAPAPTAETPASAPEQSAPAEQPATGSMDGANATMSEATGQQGHWESHYNPDLGNDVMVWVVD